MPHPKPILTTARTYVTHLQRNDAEFFFRLANSLGWQRYIGDLNLQTVADAEAYLQNRFLNSYAKNGFGYYLVENQERNPMGICGFLRKPHLTYPDFGFAMLPEFCGLGYAEESAKAVLHFGIKEFGLGIIEAEVAENNGRSLRLLEKLGFKYHTNVANDERSTQIYRKIAPV